MGWELIGWGGNLDVGEVQAQDMASVVEPRGRTVTDDF